MSTGTPSSGDPHDVSDSGDRYEALLEVLQQQKEQQARDRAREADRRASGRQAPPAWLAVLLLGVAAWLWLFPPAALRIEPPPPQPIEQEEAALRFTMYLQAQRIRSFQQEAGRLPATLEEAGPPLPGLRYTRLHEDLYQLTGETERLTLTYRSDLPLEDFAREAADVLGGDGPP